MSIPIPSGMARGKVSWRIGHDRAGSTLPGAAGKVRFEPTARAVSYASATVLPEPVETPVVAGVMTPVDLQVNDPAVWSWRVRPMVGVEWPPFALDVVAGGVDVARVAVVEASVPTRLVTAEQLAGKVDDTDPRLTNARPPTAHQHALGDVDGLTARLAALESQTGVRDITSLLYPTVVPASPSGRVLISRDGNHVTISLDAIRLAGTGNVSMFSIPGGFRPAHSIFMLATVRPSDWDSTFTAPMQGYSTGGFWLGRKHDGALYHGTFTYPTAQAWPTTLPGTPA